MERTAEGREGVWTEEYALIKRLGYYLRWDVSEKTSVLLFFIFLAAYFYDSWNGPALIFIRDSLQNFDNWFYFHQRLRSGEIAQWNPYNLFGSIAVQWNLVPVTIFTPLLLIMELTPRLFRNLHIISDILISLSLYLCARIVGYRRYLSVFPIIFLLIAPSIAPVFLYNIRIIVLLMPLLTFPLIFALMIFLSERGESAQHLLWGVYGLLVALSFTGNRLEYIVHEAAFLSISVTALGIYKWNKSAIRYILLNIIILIVAIGANSWHMVLTANSAIESGRVSTGPNFHKLFDPGLWKWIFITILYQPYLIFIILNLVIIFKISEDKKISPLRIFTIIIGEILSIVIYVSLRDFIGASSELTSTLHGYGIGSIHLWQLTICLVPAFYIYSEPTLKSTIRSILSSFCGLYIVDNLQNIYLQYPSAMNPVMFAAIVLGVSRMSYRRGTGIIILYIANIFFQTTLKFFLYDIFGIIWVEDRDFIYIIPALSLMALEGILFIADTVSHLIERDEPLLRLKKVSPAFFMGLMITIILLLTSRQSLENLLCIVHTSPNFAINRLPNSYEASLELRRTVKPTPWHRVYLPENNIFVDYLYSVIGIKSTPSHFYSGEIPSLWWNIFEPDKNIRQNADWHPEVTRQFFTYIKYKYIKEHRPLTFNPGDYDRSVILETSLKDNKLNRELTAIIGADTRRAFITYDAVRFDDYKKEYAYLKDRIDSGHKLAELVTTSDPAFQPVPLFQPDKPYKLDFQRDEPEYIELHSESDRDGYLVLMDIYSKGWKAFVDGIETKIYKGYVGMRFIALKHGVHKVTFRYECPNFKAALILSLLLWLAIVLINLIFLLKI